MCFWGEESCILRLYEYLWLYFAIFNSCFRVFACVRRTGFCCGWGVDGACRLDVRRPRWQVLMLYRCLPCACCQHTPSPSASLKVGGAGHSKKISLPHQCKRMRIDLVAVNNCVIVVFDHFEVCSSKRMCSVPQFMNEKWWACAIMTQASGEKRGLFKTIQAAKWLKWKMLCRMEGFKSTCRIQNWNWGLALASTDTISDELWTIALMCTSHSDGVCVFIGISNRKFSLGSERKPSWHYLCQRYN